MEVTLQAIARTGSGKGPARQSRMSGRVPAVLYGQGIDPIPLAVDARQMGHALHTDAKANVLVNLEVEGGKRYLTMVREIQRHPVRGNLVHIDFVNTARDVTTHADVPVSVVGDSVGVHQGGVLEHQLWELKVEALPTDIPPSIEIDITKVGIGDLIRVSDIKPPKGVQIINDPDDIVLAVIEPAARTAQEAADEAAAEEAAAAASS